MALRVDEHELGQLKPLAKGGMAEVFDLPDFRIGENPEWRLVYKRYKKQTRKNPVPIFGMEAFIRLRESWEPKQQVAMDRSFNWMVRVVTDDKSGAAGILLPRLDASYFAKKYNSYGEVKDDPCEAQLLVGSDQDYQRWRIPNPSLEQRLLICRDLALGMGKLHRTGVVYGDLSLRNFLYRLEPTVSVIYVDTDAMRLSGQSAALGRQPHTGDWEPPEALHAQRAGNTNGFATQNYQTDRYKLGLAILRILARVPRVSETRDPSHLKRVLPTSTFRMLEQSLQGKPADRPEAKDWYQEFR